MARAARRSTMVPSQTVRGRRRVWLTFDDGPHPSLTERVLDILARHGVKATFFVIGRNARAHESIVRKAFEAGHGIGNHTYTHPTLTKLSEVKVRDELKRTHDVIAPYLGSNQVFRPPYGAHNAMVDRVASRMGYRVILWNVDTVDWSAKFKPAKWVQHGLDQIRAREDSRVLNHDIHKTTADNLDTFIKRIKGLGNVTFQPPSTL
jgi:peptidoglycan/xylan/chitin deacetylase (PgdA/CDA1 family)